MNRFLQLLVLAIVIYVAIAYALPWLRSQSAGRDPGVGGTGDDGTECVEKAFRASDAFGDGITRFSRPPLDEGAWEAFVYRIQDRVSEARDSCSCPLDSCQEASRALSELDSMVGDYDSGLRGGSGPPMGAARAQDQVYDVLNRARSLARQGL